MSNDPFEQLFGEDAPEPVPARERLAHEQAERLNTAQLPEADDSEEEKPKKEKLDHPAKPWVIVGIIAVVALLASAVVINAVRSGEDPAPTPTPTPTQAAPDPTPTPTEDPEPEPEPDEDDVPEVEVGRTFTMPVAQWGIEVDVSQRLSDISYVIDGDNMVLSGSLIDSLPSSCAAMRSQWGMTRVSDNDFAVLKPSDRCREAPEVYDELWGQMDAMVKSARSI